MTQTIKFIKVRDVKTPERGTGEAAGIDFFVPTADETFVKDFVKKNNDLPMPIMARVDENSMQITVMPQGRVLIPSGFHTYLAPGTALIAANKSGIATKAGLIFGAQVVDSDYTGEIHISVINTSNTPVTIKSGDKLIQFIHTPVLLSPLEEVDRETFDKLHDNSERGAGGFGSTGTK
jgi:dUTP pyrophosphatase